MPNPVVRAPQTSDLAAPVGTFMRPTLTVEEGDSLARGSQTFRENGGPVPVVDGSGRLRGLLTDGSLARALGEARELTDPVGPFADVPETIAPYAAAAEALRKGERGQTLVVVDDALRPVGIISAVDLWPRRRVLPRPVTVGGMATPFGVYLTTGNVSAGAPWWALMATGASMFAMLMVGNAAAEWALGLHVPEGAAKLIALVVFFGLMRLVPLSGTHGAEHQVVNAIEREEVLSPEVVRRMPLVHPRCGTNLMVGLSVFSAVAFTEWYSDPTIRLLPAAILGLAFARPLGSVVQRFVTTKRPNDRQLQSAIEAGEALLLANATARYATVNPLRRIWCMGLLQVMSGAFAMVGLFWALKLLTHASWIPDVTR